MAWPYLREVVRSRASNVYAVGMSPKRLQQALEDALKRTIVSTLALPFTRGAAIYMTDPNIAAHIESFFSHVEPWIGGYQDKCLCYLGIMRGNKVDLISARLWLRHAEKRGVFRFQLGDLVAGIIPLNAFAGTARKLAEDLASGFSVSTKTSSQQYVLPADDHSSFYVPPPELLHPEGTQNGRRLSVLSISAGRVPSELVRPEIDWELRAAATPYDSLSELLHSLDLPSALGGRCKLEIIVVTPIEVSASSSVVEGKATLGLWLPKYSKIGKAKLNFRVLDKGKVVSRRSVAGTQLKWEASGSTSVGHIEINIPVGAIVQCMAVYCGTAHHTYWLADPKNFQNPRLNAYETIDRTMALLRTYLLPAQPFKGSVQSQFETAVCWLLWLVGLSPIHMGLADQSKDGPDAIVATPNGSIAVVECTLGILKEDSKLAKVARRAIVVKEKQVAAGLENTTVLPVLITALPRAEVVAEIDAATELGVLVLTRENLESALQSDIFGLPDGDQIFNRAVSNLALEKEELQKKKRGHSGDLFPK